jgi:type IX secretion system PorP/SprF family membrane protein
MIRGILFIITLSFCSLLIKAQDIHFSQFNNSFLNLNPALTGSFDGDYRFNGNFKNQWSQVSEPFQTFSFSAEAKSPFEKFDNLSLGIVLFNDEAGLGGLTTTQANISASYLKGIDLDSTWIIKAGLQLGYTARSVNFDAFNFDQQYNGRQFDANLASGENFNENSIGSINMHSGFGLEHIYDFRKTFEAGLSLFNITGPNQSFENDNSTLDWRTSIYLRSDFYLSEKMDILPSILVSTQGKFNELVVGSNLRYRLNGTNYLRENIYGGIWYRNNDAIIASAGIDYHQWNVGLSYDINISSLEIASNNRGGLELSLTYIFKDFKPIIRRYKVCPNFM